jgi:hypothetical protein
MLITTATTDNNGDYTAQLGSYSGPVIAYAFGTYMDEATGRNVTLPEARALRAALPQASGVVNNLSITGLTELAVRKAGTLTPAAIGNANALVSSIFKVNITGNKPVDANATAMAATSDKTQVDYTLALAGLSQMASANTQTTNQVDQLYAAISTLQNGITADKIDSATAKTFTDAVSTYLNTNSSATGPNGNINAVVVNNGGSQVLTVGSQQAVITITLAGTGVFGADFTVKLPAGVTVKAQADGTVDSGVIGNTASSTGASADGNYIASSGTVRIGLVSGTALPGGAILVINADLADGTTVTKDSLSIVDSVFYDANGAAVSGASLSVSGVTVR